MSLPKLIGHQTEILYLPENKNLFITGSAGSGKSLLALYRVYWLAKVHPEENVVLLTYNRPVNNDMKEKLYSIAYERNEKFPGNLIVETYHMFMQNFITQLWEFYGDNLNNLKQYILTDKNISKRYNVKKKEIVKRALELVKEKYPQEVTLDRPLKVFVDEITWMQQMSIKTEQQYINAERIGRKDTRIERTKRFYFFKVYEKYKELRTTNNYPGMFDYEDVGTIVRELLDSISEKDEFYNHFKNKYIFIDEFQDFTSDMLMTINELLGDYGYLSLLGDVNQGVFGKRVSFKSLGINMSRFQRHILDNNYRNTREISDFAELLTDSPYFDKKNEYYINAKKGTRHGDLPKISIFKSEEQELEQLMHYLKSEDFLGAHIQSIAILIPTGKFNMIKGYLEKYNIDYKDVRNIQSDTKEKVIYIGSYFRIKGLEFDAVFMPFMNKETFKNIVSQENEEIDINREDFSINQVGEELLEEHVARIYVGITRARETLFISATNTLTPFLNSKEFEQYYSYEE